MSGARSNRLRIPSVSAFGDRGDIERVWERQQPDGCHTPVTPVCAVQRVESDRVTGVTALVPQLSHPRLHPRSPSARDAQKPSHTIEPMFPECQCDLAMRGEVPSCAERCTDNGSQRTCYESANASKAPSRRLRHAVRVNWARSGPETCLFPVRTRRCRAAHSMARFSHGGA